MSHAHGEVIKGNKVVGYYEYNGTSDYAISHIYDTQEEVSANWRSGKTSRCTCGKEPEDVILYADYGCGFHWTAKACLDCRAIVAGEFPYEDDLNENGPTDGHPIDPDKKGDLSS